MHHSMPRAASGRANLAKRTPADPSPDGTEGNEWISNPPPGLEQGPRRHLDVFGTELTKLSQFELPPDLWITHTRATYASPIHELLSAWPGTRSLDIAEKTPKGGELLKVSSMSEAYTTGCTRQQDWPQISQQLRALTGPGIRDENPHTYRYTHIQTAVCITTDGRHGGTQPPPLPLLQGCCR
ncbi:hypothetical protein VTK26DRAFT_3545 [Humicola hyalothermophila]